jgi:hypothetical protein
MNTLKKTLTALIFSTLGFSFTTSATPVITSWDFIVDSAFTDSSYSIGTGTPTESNDNVLFGEPTNLAWGNQAIQSSLDIGSGSLGNVWMNGLSSGTAAETSRLVHNNITIPGGSSGLITATLSTLLQLVPASGGLGFPPADPINALDFDIFFKETPNISGMCGGVPCSNDIFVIAMPTGVIFDQGEGTLNQQFTIAEHTYNTELKLVSTLNGTGLSVLHNDICDKVPGAENGCIGLTTFEKQSNEFKVMMTITHVPEPSTILLLSLALFGIAASARNKHV